MSLKAGQRDWPKTGSFVLQKKVLMSELPGHECATLEGTNKQKEIPVEDLTTITVEIPTAQLLDFGNTFVLGLDSIEVLQKYLGIIGPVTFQEVRRRIYSLAHPRSAAAMHHKKTWGNTPSQRDRSIIRNHIYESIEGLYEYQALYTKQNRGKSFSVAAAPIPDLSAEKVSVFTFKNYSGSDVFASLRSNTEWSRCRDGVMRAVGLQRGDQPMIVKQQGRMDSLLRACMWYQSLNPDLQRHRLSSPVAIEASYLRLRSAFTLVGSNELQESLRDLYKDLDLPVVHRIRREDHSINDAALRLLHIPSLSELDDLCLHDGPIDTDEPAIVEYRQSKLRAVVSILLRSIA